MAKQKEQRELSPAERVLAQWASEANEVGVGLPDWDPEFSMSFPNLWVFMTWTRIGKVQKDPGSVSMRVDGTGWRLTYYDPAARKSATVIDPTLMGALRKLDGALVSPDTVWSGKSRTRGFRKVKE